MYTWGIKDFHKCWSGPLAKRRLCLGPAGVINYTPLSALSFWVSLFPRKRGCNTQTHVHWLGDAIQPSHPLLSPSPPAFNLSQHQGLFQWVRTASSGQSTGISASASVLPMEHPGLIPLGWTGWIPLQSKGLSRVFYNTTVQKHQLCSAFFIVQLSHPYMTTRKT